MSRKKKKIRSEEAFPKISSLKKYIQKNPSKSCSSEAVFTQISGQFLSSLKMKIHKTTKPFLYWNLPYKSTRMD